MEVLYRKYRPQKFADVVGQDSVVKTLEAQVKNGSISHAYLFAGSRGTGKTSIARILARELGTSPNDIYEIDAASKTSVDDIRELNESVSTLPFDSKYKVYILDEVHMLSKSASNAFLKTLEEPPEHVVFILATTETHKIPETILSRCEVHTFKKPNQETLKKVVQNVAKKEGYTIADSSADLIALIGDGSFRDTLGTLQKVLSSSKDKKISESEVLLVTGAPKSELVNEIVQGIADKDLKKSLVAVKEASEANLDMSVLLKLLLQKMRAVLLIRFGSSDMVKGDLSEDDFMFISKIASDKTIDIGSETIIKLLDAYTTTSRAYIASLPLELALIEKTHTLTFTAVKVSV
jgi:DNA polymerase-3 subunit gamma/tau